MTTKRGALGCSTVAAFALFLAGCEGIGIPASGDPNFKLSQAEYLVSGPGRIMQARRVTEQAIALFEQRGDKAGLARAYREYGLIALDGGLADNPVILRDPKTPLRPSPEDLNRAESHLKHALDLAHETDQRYVAANIAFVLGNIEVLRGAPQKGCPYYKIAIEGFRDAQLQQPGVKLDLPQGATDPADYVERAKKEAGC